MQGNFHNHVSLPRLFGDHHHPGELPGHVGHLQEQETAEHPGNIPVQPRVSRLFVLYCFHWQRYRALLLYFFANQV